jgi:hypothetical protein
MTVAVPLAHLDHLGNLLAGDDPRERCGRQRLVVGMDEVEDAASHHLRRVPAHHVRVRRRHVDVAAVHAAVCDQVHAVVDDEAVLRVAAQHAVERRLLLRDVGEGAGPPRAPAPGIDARKPGHHDLAQGPIHAPDPDLFAECRVPRQRVRDAVRRRRVRGVRAQPVGQARRDGERRQRALCVVDGGRADALRIRCPDARDKRCRVWHGILKRWETTP